LPKSVSITIAIFICKRSGNIDIVVLNMSAPKCSLVRETWCNL
jgi:hypothetical protein